MINKSLIKILCQECINSYNGKHGEVKKNLKNITYIDTGKVEAHIGEYKNYIVVVFRGSDSFKDWLDNLNFKKTDIGAGIKIHTGFLNQYLNIKSEINCEILNRSYKDREIIFTGHSLGGALATISCYMSSFYSICVTFGSPRVGNKKFQKHFDAIIRNSRRYVNGNDIVCKVPTLWMNFKHVKGKRKIGKKLSWREKLLNFPYKIFGNPLDHYPQEYLENL